ncbi:ATP-dependent helicase, partial [Micromonospora echinofusca]|nr:ATP-dependent helicase [Micromonospora echinofusca]
VLELGDAEDQRGVAGALTAFVDRWRAHDEREERRLAYVAVTRPRRLLLCSGYWWGEGTKRPRGPSVLLREIHDTCLDGRDGYVVDVWAPEPAGDATNPTTEVVLRAEWPADPLGARRPVIAEGAALVRRFLTDPPAGPGDPDRADLDPADLDPADPDRADPDRVDAEGTASGLPEPDEVVRGWRREVDLLLAERATLVGRDGPVEVGLPGQLSVSQLVALRRDPQALAGVLRRPMPTRPDPYA